MAIGARGLFVVSIRALKALVVITGLRKPVEWIRVNRSTAMQMHHGAL
jgi:hypothetical protein